MKGELHAVVSLELSAEHVLDVRRRRSRRSNRRSKAHRRTRGHWSIRFAETETAASPSGFVIEVDSCPQSPSSVSESAGSMVSAERPLRQHASPAVRERYGSRRELPARAVFRPSHFLRELSRYKAKRSVSRARGTSFGRVRTATGNHAKRSPISTTATGYRVNPVRKPQISSPTHAIATETAISRHRTGSAVRSRQTTT